MNTCTNIVLEKKKGQVEAILTCQLQRHAHVAKGPEQGTDKHQYKAMTYNSKFRRPLITLRCTVVLWKSSTCPILMFFRY